MDRSTSLNRDMPSLPIRNLYQKIHLYLFCIKTIFLKGDCHGWILVHHKKKTNKFLLIIANSLYKKTIISFSIVIYIIVFGGWLLIFMWLPSMAPITPSISYILKNSDFTLYKRWPVGYTIYCPLFLIRNSIIFVIIRWQELLVTSNLSEHCRNDSVCKDTTGLLKILFVHLSFLFQCYVEVKHVQLQSYLKFMQVKHCNSVYLSMDWPRSTIGVVNFKP